MSTPTMSHDDNMAKDDAKSAPLSKGINCPLSAQTDQYPVANCQKRHHFDRSNGVVPLQPALEQMG